MTTITTIRPTEADLLRLGYRYAKLSRRMHRSDDPRLGTMWGAAEQAILDANTPTLQAMENLPGPARAVLDYRDRATFYYTTGRGWQQMADAHRALLRLFRPGGEGWRRYHDCHVTTRKTQAAAGREGERQGDVSLPRNGAGSVQGRRCRRRTDHGAVDREASQSGRQENPHEARQEGLTSGLNRYIFSEHESGRAVLTHPRPGPDVLGVEPAPSYGALARPSTHQEVRP